MPREYIQRRNPPVGRSDRPRPGSGRYNKRKKSGPPPFIILALLLIVVIVTVVLIVTLRSRGGKDDTKNPPVSSEITSAVSEPAESKPSAEPSKAEPTPTPVPEAPAESIPEGDPEKLSSLLRIGNTGYEYYNFVEDYAKQYITTVSGAGEQLGSIPLYDIIIPTSMDITLPESYITDNGINSSDQKKAINYLYSSINAMNPNVKTVPIFDALKLKNNDYIYFRTDHHWTQLGAYYAYVEFCGVKGLTPVPLEDFDKKEYPGFLGSFYNDAPNSAMANDPDTVVAYIPRGDINLAFTDRSGTTFDTWPLIANGDTYDAPNLYLIYCAADQPYEKITNADISDGSSCVVVKESFGNVFIPFLTSHYETVYVIDYRYYTGDISEFAKENNVDDVILLNNISMTRNEGLISDLQNTF